MFFICSHERSLIQVFGPRGKKMSYKILYHKKDCIGAGECEMFSPDFWQVNNQGKAELKGATENEDNVFERIISDEEYQKQKGVAGSCPIGCIKIVKVD